MSRVELSDPRKHRIIWSPRNIENPWFPQKKAFGVWWNYTGTNEGGGTQTWCYPTFKEALKHITDEQARYNTLMKSVDVEKYALGVDEEKNE